MGRGNNGKGGLVVLILFGGFIAIWKVLEVVFKFVLDAINAPTKRLEEERKQQDVKDQEIAQKKKTGRMVS